MIAAAGMLEVELLDMEERYHTLRERYPEAHPQVQALVQEFRALLKRYEALVG